jgi:hypothetical protein
LQPQETAPDKLFPPASIPLANSDRKAS